jgi:spartin
VTTTAVTDPGYGAEAVTETLEDVLVRVRGAMVHLVDDQESPLLAEGDFSVVRIEQEGNGIVAFVRVGDNLRWPLTKDESVVKLDSSHYFFTIRVPRRVDDMDRDTAGASQECMSYGVTFSAAGQERQMRELDEVLEQYSGFSTPQLVHGDRERDEFDGAFGYGHNQPPRGRPVPEEVVSSKGKRVTESNEAEFWRTMAPNVNDYNSDLAKTMAKGTGNIIKGIFWLRDSTLAQLENGSEYVRGQVRPSSKPGKISSQTLTNLKRARNMSIATEQVAKSVLDGVVKAAGFFSGALMRSQVGKKFFQLLPGEVALVSMDAFAKVFDAVEKAGTDVMKSTAMFTKDVVTHRYGEEAGQVTGNSLSTAGHVFATAWTVSKVRSALNPAKFRPSKTGMLKAAAKAAVAGGRSK